jgi:hypothetical protein
MYENSYLMLYVAERTDMLRREAARRVPAEQFEVPPSRVSLLAQRTADKFNGILSAWGRTMRADNTEIIPATWKSRRTTSEYPAV